MSAEEQTAKDELRAWFTLLDGKGGSYPFVEDENCNVHGYGHQDKGEFACAVNRFDREEGGVDEEDAAWTAEDITHRWAVMDPDGEYFRVVIPAPSGDDSAPELVGPDTPGAFPITCLRNQR